MTDVLIVGAGSAGSILAERLSADPARSVTLVEAGPDAPALTADATTLPIDAHSPVVRRYRSTLTDDPVRTADLVRGACIGGSGAVNGGYFCRALPRDMAALPGWTWEQAAAHFDSVEERIGITTATHIAGATAAFLAAADDAGIRRLPDLTADGTGVAAVPLNIDAGVRRGPGLVYLEPALARSNLTALTNTRSVRVRTAAGRAVGVDAVGPDGPISLDADHVVLCAGAIGSAQLLLLSGIGPAADLRALGIPVVADLPVGRRCWDHPEWQLTTHLPNAAGHPVLEAVMVTGELEIRPYTTGFGVGEYGATTPVGVALMRPRARGRLRLASADPGVAPHIEQRYDSDAADLADLSDGCDLVAGLLGGAGGEPVWSTSQHLSGTAPMGTVTDSRCAVLGVQNLAVVDGSVLAEPLSRGPHATVAMLAHRAAELL